MFRETSISNPLIRKRMCAYQGVKNVSFLENFAYILIEWSLTAEKYNGIIHLAQKIFRGT